MTRDEWKYSTADRCVACNARALIPSGEIADRFIAKSEGRLIKVECPVNPGQWHLVYPAVELAGGKQSQN